MRNKHEVPDNICGLANAVEEKLSADDLAGWVRVALVRTRALGPICNTPALGQLEIRNQCSLRLCKQAVKIVDHVYRRIDAFPLQVANCEAMCEVLHTAQSIWGLGRPEHIKSLTRRCLHLPGLSAESYYMRASLRLYAHEYYFSQDLSEIQNLAEAVEREERLDQALQLWQRLARMYDLSRHSGRETYALQQVERIKRTMEEGP